MCNEVHAEEVSNFMVGKHAYECTNVEASDTHLYGAGNSRSCYSTVILCQGSDLPFLITNGLVLVVLRMPRFVPMCDPAPDVKMLLKNFPGMKVFWPI